MPEFAWPWVFLLLPLPWLVRLLPARPKREAALRVPDLAAFASYGAVGGMPARRTSGRLALLWVLWIALLSSAARPELIGDPVSVRGPAISCGGRYLGLHESRRHGGGRADRDTPRGRQARAIRVRRSPAGRSHRSDPVRLQRLHAGTAHLRPNHRRPSAAGNADRHRRRQDRHRRRDRPGRETPARATRRESRTASCSRTAPTTSAPSSRSRPPSSQRRPARGSIRWALVPNACRYRAGSAAPSERRS